MRIPVLRIAGLVAVALVAASRAATAADEPFTEAVARTLLAEAGATVDDELLVRLDTAASLHDVELGPIIDLPRAALSIAQAGVWPPGAARDFSFDATATPPIFARALRGDRTTAPTLLHPRFIESVVVSSSGQASAKAEIVFRASDVFSGRASIEAFRASGGWRITAFDFPNSRVRITRSPVRPTRGDGRWRLIQGIARNPDVALPVVAGGARLPDLGDAAAVFLPVGGPVTTEGVPTPGYRDVADALAARGRRRAAPSSPLYQNVELVVFADDRVPWAAIAWTLMAAAQTKVHRIHFAAKHRASGEIGGLSIDLPEDRGGVSLHDPRPAAPRVKVAMLHNRDRTDTTALDALHARLLLLVRENPGLVVELEIARPGADQAPYGDVVRLLDAAYRAGVRAVNFMGSPPLGWKETTLDAAIARAVVRPRGSVSVRVAGVESAPGTPSPIPDGPRPSSQPPRPPPTDGPWSLDAMDEPPTPEETEDVEETVVSGKFRSPFQTLRWRAMNDRGPARIAVERALMWLAAHQSDDGRWEAAGFHRWCDRRPSAGSLDGVGSATNDVGVTGLALLAFLGAGYTNRSEGSYGKVVGNGMQYLKNVQDPEGCFGSRIASRFIYGHAIASLAMIEAYALTGSSNFMGSAQRALAFIALARNPYFVWRYGVKPGDNDTSVTAWMAMALNVARLSNAADTKVGKPPSLTFDIEALERTKAWLDRMTDPKTGRVGYVQPGSGPARLPDQAATFPTGRSESLTAAGVFLRIVLGEDPAKSDAVRKGVALCAALPPTWNGKDGSIDMHYWHHGSLAAFQVGGDLWTAWEAAMASAFVDSQRTDGNACGYLGSWDPVDPWGPEGGRVYATAMMALCLEAPYRYERVFPDPRPK